MITHEQLLNACTKLAGQFSIDELLRELYPLEEAWQKAWADTVERFKPGTEVSGLVVHKAPFGDFIDIGASEPALLEITSMPTLTPTHYRSGNYNPIGSTVKAWVLGLPSERTKQLLLTQNSSTDFNALNLPHFYKK